MNEYIKCFQQCLAHSKHSKSVRCCYCCCLLSCFQIYAWKYLPLTWLLLLRCVGWDYTMGCGLMQAHFLATRLYSIFWLCVMGWGGHSGVCACTCRCTPTWNSLKKGRRPDSSVINLLSDLNRVNILSCIGMV